MTEYVVRSWAASETTTGGPHIIIEGRAAGLVSWLLSMLKIDPGISLIVTADKIIHMRGDPAGRGTQITPLENVCSTHYGVTKPWLEALLLALVAGAVTWFLLGIPGIVLGVLYYIFKTTMTLGFTAISGERFTFHFKRAMLGGVAIDAEKAATTCNILQQLIDAKLARRG